jgi:hypothetical protein
MALRLIDTADGKALLLRDGKLATTDSCCCGGGGQPTTCECVDWCCVRPGLLIDGYVLPFMTFEEYLNEPGLFQGTYAQALCPSNGMGVGFMLPDPGRPQNPDAILAGGQFTLNCADGVATVQMQFQGFQSGCVYSLSWVGTALINFDCNSGPLSVGEWTIALCARENVVLDPALEPELCAPPATIVFNGTFPCNPLP